MLFYLKKVTGGLLLPLPFLLLVIAAGILLLWFSRWQKAGKILISVGWLALLLLSLQPVADRLLQPVEESYPTWNGDAKYDYIVVLGGGYTYNPDWAPSSNLISNSLPRVTEGVRQWLRNPSAIMVFTGAAGGNNPMSNAETAAKVAQSLGVPADHTLALSQPKDTEEESHAVRAAIGDHPFLLVTSASHLPRAMRFFEAAGLKPIPVPANQMAITSPLYWFERVTPSAVWLGHSERAGYELLGQLWQWMKGIRSPSTEPRQ